MNRHTHEAWTARTLGRGAYELRYTRDHRRLTDAVRARLAGPGLALIRGTPAGSLPTRHAQDFTTALLAPLGHVLPQGRDTDTATGWLVRDEGASRHTDDRRFRETAYTSKSRGPLHLHNDQAVEPFGHTPRLIALAVHRAAARGGATLLADGHTVHRILGTEHPAELDVLARPFPFDRRHVTPAGRPAVVHAPVVEAAAGRIRLRVNLTRIETAAELTRRPLSPPQRRAVDVLRAVLARPGLVLALPLSQGDCLVLDDRRVLHGRTAYADHPDPGRRRCLIRVMLA
ncbi:TauD/TfdA family dioxygenase [Streptomyces sp. NPDC007369]|uniref:TauD/TfdA family dioxygenase n=1 Tax=Streptomyces sp. NPDC007369 TaxID=3154589 RepID=UPI0033C142CD